MAFSKAWKVAIERGTPVKEDTVAILQTQGLTGIAYVELTAGRRNSPPLVARPGEEFPVIRAGPSLLTRLETSVTVLLGFAFVALIGCETLRGRSFFRKG